MHRKKKYVLSVLRCMLRFTVAFGWSHQGCASVCPPGSRCTLAIFTKVIIFGTWGERTSAPLSMAKYICISNVKWFEQGNSADLLHTDSFISQFASYQFVLLAETRHALFVSFPPECKYPGAGKTNL